MWINKNLKEKRVKIKIKNGWRIRITKIKFRIIILNLKL